MREKTFAFKIILTTTLISVKLRCQFQNKIATCNINCAVVGTCRKIMQYMPFKAIHVKHTNTNMQEKKLQTNKCLLFMWTFFLVKLPAFINNKQQFPIHNIWFSYSQNVRQNKCVYRKIMTKSVLLYT